MRRALSLSLILALLLETSSWAQTLRVTAAPPAQAALPPAVPVNAALADISLSPQKASLALMPSALPLVAPAVSAPALAPAAASASLRSPRPQVKASPAPNAARAPLRRMLAAAAAALAQNSAARRVFPGLGRLGADVQGPRQEQGLEGQSAAAERLFDQKTFGSQAGPAGSVDADAARAPSDQKLARPERPSPYPTRRLRHNGKDFPSILFRPETELEPQLVKAIDSAKKSVHVALYEFRMHDTLRALRRARERGVEVHIIADKGNVFPTRPGHPDWSDRRDVEMQLLINEGFDLSVLDGLWVYGIQHNRFAVIDGELAVFGAARWTPDQELNEYATAQFSDDRQHVGGLLKYWEYLRGVAVPWEKARGHQWPKTVPAPPQDASLDVRFNGADLPAWFSSPGGAAEDWIVKAIDAAKESLDVAMFTFRSTRIAQALLRAQRRGVDVRALLDRGQSGRDFMKPYAEWLAYHKIAVSLVSGPDAAQKFGRYANQFLVADGKLLQTGSMNWTKNAFLMSFENGHFFTDAKDVKAFAAYFDDIFRSRKAERLLPPKTEPALPSDEDLVKELQVEPAPPPSSPAFPEMPAVPQIGFNGESFPAAVVRPHTPIEPLLVKAIDATKKTLRIALYEFNLQDVLDALLRAKRRGVDVQIIFDYSHVYPGGKATDAVKPQRKAQIQALIDAGFDLVALRGFGHSGIMHNKFAVFDGALVEFGSYNWSDTAEHNHFENALFSDEAERIALFEKYWDWMRSLAKPIEKAEGFDWESSNPGPPPADTQAPIELNGVRFAREMFSPRGTIQSAILAAIRAAKTSVEIAMFTFASQEIADALLEMKEKGVNVRIVLDASQTRTGKFDEWFAYHGFDVKILAGPDPHGPWMFEKNHNKFMIVDGKLVETGSYNYTGNAENNNFENVNFIADAARVAFFSAFFQMLHDLGWKPKAPKEPPAVGSPDSDSEGY